MLRPIGSQLHAGDTQPKMSPSSPKTPGLAPSWASGKVMAKPVPGSWGCQRHTWGIPTALGSLCPCGDHPGPCPGAAAHSEGTRWGQAGVMAGVAHGQRGPQFSACTGMCVFVCFPIPPTSGQPRAGWHPQKGQVTSLTEPLKT